MIRAMGGEIDVLGVDQAASDEEGEGVQDVRGQLQWDLDDQGEERSELDEDQDDQEEEEDLVELEDQEDQEEDAGEFDGDVDEREMQAADGDGEQSVEYESMSEDTDPKFKNVTYLDGAKQVEHDLVLTQEEIDTMRRDGKRRRTFVVSATIGTSFWTSRFMNKKVRKETKKKRKTDENYNPKIAEILDKLTFNFKCKTIDLTKDQLLPTNLEILKINCNHAEKLLYLTHFVRTFENEDIIIFTNSIPATKKIRAILETMSIESVNLHSHQQQKQRLQKLEAFRSSKKRILIATDVASRGLDIPQVSIVLHYHLPKDLDTFLHRCGRTGRTGGKDGKAIMIADADDQSRFIKWKKDLPQNVIKNIEVNIKKLDEIRHFVEKAGVIEKENFKIAKENKELIVKKKFAKQLEVDITEDEHDEYEKEEVRVQKDRREKIARSDTAKYKKDWKLAEASKFQTLKKGVFLQPGDMAGMLDELKRAKANKGEGGKGVGGGGGLSKSRQARRDKKSAKNKVRDQEYHDVMTNAPTKKKYKRH
jgi:superfamily II DNA/RNA helicase